MAYRSMIKTSDQQAIENQHWGAGVVFARGETVPLVLNPKGEGIIGTNSRNTGVVSSFGDKMLFSRPGHA